VGGMTSTTRNFPRLQRGTASDIELYNSLHKGRHRFKQWPIWLWCLKRRPAGGQLGLLVAEICEANPSPEGAASSAALPTLHIR
jgi:hypothetical protein